MTTPGTVHPAEAILPMHSGDTLRARQAIRTIRNSLWERKTTPFAFEGLLEAFRTLLRRRGYFVSSPSDLSTTLGDLHTLGQGFDLYDLAEDLAALDTVWTQCLKAAPRPLFPDLAPFAPKCPCGQHPKAAN